MTRLFKPFSLTGFHLWSILFFCIACTSQGAVRAENGNETEALLKKNIPEGTSFEDVKLLLKKNRINYTVYIDTKNFSDIKKLKLDDSHSFFIRIYAKTRNRNIYYHSETTTSITIFFNKDNESYRIFSSESHSGL